MIPHNQLSIGRAECDAVSRLVSSGRWTTGEECACLEHDLCEITGRTHAVTVASGLSAIRLALAALGVGPGDEIVLPAYSCVALPNAVLSLGAVPVPADIDRATYNLSRESCEHAMTRRTKAIIAVHTFGVPAAVPDLAAFGVPVIEDCAHALGFDVAGNPIGSRADIAITSFYSTKLVGGGQGGAVLTNSANVAGSVRDLRDYADKEPSPLRLNDRMMDLAAALARAQLARLATLIERRRHLAEVYLEELAHRMPELLVLPEAVDDRCWYRFVVERRDGHQPAADIVRDLGNLGVAAAHPVEPWLDESSLANHPNSMSAAKRVVSLPLFAGMSASHVKRVAAAVEKVVAPQ